MTAIDILEQIDAARGILPPCLDPDCFHELDEIDKNHAFLVFGIETTKDDETSLSR